MSDRTCELCGKTFRWPSDLDRHKKSKKSCKFIPQVGTDKLQCKQCGRTYAHASSLSRHVGSCNYTAAVKPENSKALSDDMRRDLLEILAEFKTNLNSDLTSKLDNLKSSIVGEAKQVTAAILETQPTQSIQSVNIGNKVASSVNNIQNNTLNNTIQLFIAPWDGAKCISIEASDVIKAFAKNPRLQDYICMGPNQFDKEQAPPYVAELFMELIRNGHADPSMRNVYINPRRADQVLTLMTNGRWQVTALVDASRMMLDGIAQRLVDLTRITGRGALPYEECSAASAAALMYRSEPDKYVQMTKPQMAAHLANTAPEPGIEVRAGKSLPPPAPPLYPGVRPPRPQPAERRWATGDTVEQLVRCPRHADETLVDWAARLVAEAGVDEGRWCNKLWEALDEKMIPDSGIAEARELLGVAERH